MRLTPPTKYTFYSSIVLAVFALVLYLGSTFGVVEHGVHFAFWLAIVAWLWMAVGTAARGV
jgi:hypothetical protein